MAKLDSSNIKYDVFIAHSTKNMKFLTSLCDALVEKEGFKVLNPGEDFISGVGIVENITKGVEECRRMLLLLSKEFLESEWFVFETMLALHHAIQHKKQLMIPVLLGISENEVPLHLKGINYIKYEGDFSNPAGNEGFMQRVIDALKAEDIPMAGTLPAGNIAHGLAWSYFYGYLRLILPGFKKRVMESQYWNDDLNQRQILIKLFILLPNSCFCWSTLTDNDPKVIKAGPLEAFKASRAGNVEREYRNFVYKVTDVDGKDYYCAVEYATPLMSMYEMEYGRIAGLTEEEKMYQKQQFEHILNNILTHANAKECHGSYQLLTYDDKIANTNETDGPQACYKGYKYPISQLLIKEIKKGLAKEIPSKSVEIGVGSMKVVD